MHPACGFAGILTPEERRKSWENLGWELLGG